MSPNVCGVCKEAESILSIDLWKQLNYFRFCLHAPTFIAPFDWSLREIFEQKVFLLIFTLCELKIVSRALLQRRTSSRVYLSEVAQISNIKGLSSGSHFSIRKQPSHLSPLNWTGNSELKLNGRRLFTLRKKCSRLESVHERGFLNHAHLLSIGDERNLWITQSCGDDFPLNHWRDWTFIERWTLKDSLSSESREFG